LWLSQTHVRKSDYAKEEKRRRIEEEQNLERSKAKADAEREAYLRQLRAKVQNKNKA
jgi:hypothetical protein